MSSSSLGLDRALDRGAVIRLGRLARRAVRICAFVLVLVFSWLQFEGLNWASIARDLPSDLVFKTAMALYFLCWVAGCLSDIGDQELVYLRAPNKGHMPGGGWVIAALLTAGFGLMCWVSSFEQFTVVLAGFLLVNVVGWYYLVNQWLPRTVVAMEEDYKRDCHYIELEQLRLVFHEYLAGRWQWFRFAAGCLLIGTLIASTFSPLGSGLAVLVGFSRDLVLALEILLFVVIMEAWVWMMRIRTKTGWRLLEDLKVTYFLTRQARGA